MKFSTWHNKQTEPYVCDTFKELDRDAKQLLDTLIEIYSRDEKIRHTIDALKELLTASIFFGSHREKFIQDKISELENQLQ